MLSNKFKRALEKKGFYFNYSLDKDIIIERRNEILDLYNKADFTEINEELIQFLIHFKDKEIVYYDTLHFNLEKALICTQAKGLEIHFELKNVIPFGLAFREHMQLIIDEDNRVYATMDNILIHFGNDPFEALLNILNNKQIDRMNII